MKLSETVLASPVRLALWGGSGTGKTSLIGQMAKYEELRPIYIFDFDLRIESLTATLSKELLEFVEYDPYRDKVVQGDAFTAAEAMRARLESDAMRGKAHFKTIAVDSDTFMQACIYNRVLMLDGAKPSTFTPQLQHHLQQMTLNKDFLSKCCALPYNFICTFHEDTSKDELTGRIFKGIDVTGKDINKIPGYFNEMWHSEIQQMPGQEPVFVVRTRSDAIYTARTSFRFLKNVEPIETVWAKVIEGRKA